MIASQLRVVGASQTNVVMAAELIRIAQRALGRRPPEPRKEGLGQLVYEFDPELAWAATTYLRTPTRVVWDVYRGRARPGSSRSADVAASRTSRATCARSARR